MAGMNTITTFRMPDGRQVGFEDWSDKPLFCTVDLVHGFTVQELDFMGYTEGDAVPAAPGPAGVVQRDSTKRDTNVQAPNAMASTEERLIYAIKPEIFMVSAADPGQGQPVEMETAVPTPGTGEPIPNTVALGVLNFHLLLTLQITQKNFARAGLAYFNAGFGVNGAGSTMNTAAATGRTYATNGLPSQEAVRSFVVPQYMGGTEKVRLFLSNPGGRPVNFGNSENDAVDTNPLAVIQMRVYLEGLYKRPVS